MDLESGLDMGFFQKGWNGEEVGLGEFVGWVCWVCLNGFGLGWVCVGLGPGGFYMRTLSVAHRMKSAFLRDWSTFPWYRSFGGSVFEWSHSMDDDTWANIPSRQPEFKVNVSILPVHPTF